MPDVLARRTLLRRSVGGAGLVLGLDAGAAQAAAASAMPWIKRFLHMYTGADGLSRLEEIPIPAPTALDTQQLLRRNVERLTLSTRAPGYGGDFHNANQPTLLIPLFGSIVIGLADGTKHEFGHGDIAYAEDCTGKGHQSYAGAQGCFTVQIQLAKPLCPAVGSTDMAHFWKELS